MREGRIRLSLRVPNLCKRDFTNGSKSGIKRRGGKKDCHQKAYMTLLPSYTQANLTNKFSIFSWRRDSFSNEFLSRMKNLILQCHLDLSLPYSSILHPRGHDHPPEQEVLHILQSLLLKSSYKPYRSRPF